MGRNGCKVNDKVDIITVEYILAPKNLWDVILPSQFLSRPIV